MGDGPAAGRAVTLPTVLNSDTMKTVPTLLPSPPDIPVRRYGTIPDLPDDTVYVAEPLQAAGTIAERGGFAVLLAAMLVGGIAAWLLYF
jgi:hypothetical protein